ncbi:phenylalanine--tRNA ligase subunit beta [Ferruginibacter yonginensis]|uniref:Phenylalanine--tRNA ligase beta subunit n=1 Tax=Ferruginibacter yonginensis TaxID=1310416 RepID=A0ABV8QSU6_9BACT
MIISYNWLSDYLPTTIDPQKLSKILTSIGLEVESLHPYESIKGGLAGLVVGEVLTCEKHPDADKLKITTVNIGTDTPSQIVCGASNVAAGQKVIVATVGSTIYPTNGEPLQIKKAKIRGVESQGMICAEDEIGVGESHAGIMVLPAETIPGTAANTLFETYSDFIYEIGLTPNRMDAMSHLGVAKDVCAYLWHHDKKETKAVLPFKNNFKADNNDIAINVTIEATEGCQRYAGVSINNITVAESPTWLQNKLKSIGLKPINNVVDVTNFILHETGQPLHAFDIAKITGNTIKVKNATAGEKFTTLDEKERTLFENDVMIANANEHMCIAGVYGGLHSGVSNATTAIFLESAWFNPSNIRKTSLQHGLRTDAATRFEKGVDISNTVNVLKRAALLIKEIAGGTISSDIIDLYPAPQEKTAVAIKYHYLKKLSGKNYHADTIKNILTALGFEIQKEGIDEMWLSVPYSKPDISIAADIVEEIMRIDGLDNVEIPATISIAPSADNGYANNSFAEKMANYLTGNGFHEIFTNSITDSKYYDEATLQHTVKMINNLSADLDVMRPSLLQTGLEVIAYNINRKNNDVKLYEFGKTYHSNGIGKYAEKNRLAIFTSGIVTIGGWQSKDMKADFYHIKGICEKIIMAAGIKNTSINVVTNQHMDYAIEVAAHQQTLATIGSIHPNTLKQFGIKDAVMYADIAWDELMVLQQKNNITFKEISKFPAVQRDLAIIVDKAVTYAAIEQNVKSHKIQALKSIKLFDIFESEKIGSDKRSMAVNFTFSDEAKTFADAETDAMMQQIINGLEKQLNATIRK